MIFILGGKGLRKLKEQEAIFIKSIINDESTIEIDDKEYVLSLIEKPSRIKGNQIPNIKNTEHIAKTKMEILQGKTHKIDDIVDLMDQGVL